MIADDTRTSEKVTSWDQLPLMLSPEEMAALYGVSQKTISRWQRDGHIPPPVVSAGHVRRWDREIVKQHLERRQQLR